MKTMKYPVRIGGRVAVVVIAAAAMIAATWFLESGRKRGQSVSAANTAAASADISPDSGDKSNASEPSVDLTPTQLNSIKIGTVAKYQFPVDNESVGSIDFDEDLTVPVFPDYQGTIIQTFGELAAGVQKDQPLYTIKSPDLIQAESNLIAAAAAFELTNKELARAKDLRAVDGVSEREVEQATSDQATADGALKAARDAVRVFGKTDAEIDQMIASRKIDPALVVRSPISGTITARNAQPGFLVQPGNLPAPYSVSDFSLKWMLASVLESDISKFHVGQPVEAKVLAYKHLFTGKISKIYATADPNTHRIIVRSEISDPNNELRPGMLANFVIRVEPPVESTAVPANGVVREGDGTITAWVTTDRRHFTQRIVQPGLRKDGWVQILSGLQPGEQVVTDGAVFLSSMLEAPATD